MLRTAFTTCAAALVLCGCGTTAEGAEREPAPAATAPPAPAPPHPSGASPADLAVFRWISTDGAALQSTLSGACGAPLSACAAAPPDDRAACFEAALPACDAAIASARGASVPDEVRGGFGGFTRMCAHTACVYRVVLDELRGDPSFAGRLRDESGVRLIAREAERGDARAVAAQERMSACSTREGHDDLGSVEAWMRARFGCATPQPSAPGDALPTCGTVERAGAMARAGIEPQPRSPGCR